MLKRCLICLIMFSQSSESVSMQLSPVTPQIQLPLPAQAGGSCSSGGGSVASRRRRTVDHDPDERRQKFLERNRAAATRCRQKRKLWVSSLEKKAEELTHTNLQLQVSPLSLPTLYPATLEDNQHCSPFISLQFNYYTLKRPSNVLK